MAQFNGSVLTNMGFSLLMKAQTGGARIEFTRIGIGDGYASDDLSSLTELINEVISLEILNISINGLGESQVRAVISNADLESPLYVREIGLFANDPDYGEILYSVANSGALADYLPAPNGADVVEEIINFYTFIGTAETVTAVIQESAVVTVDIFDLHKNDTNIHITRAEFNAQIASLRNEVNLIKSTFPDSFTHNLFTEDLSTLTAIKLTKGYYNELQTRLEV